MMRILIVDDDPWSGRITSRLLERRGHDVVTAIDLGDARDKLADLAALELVLLDIHLPGGTGDALLREIRTRSERLPVIAVTASAMAGDRERFLNQGFTAYVSKPLDVRSFAETVERYGGTSR